MKLTAWKLKKQKKLVDYRASILESQLIEVEFVCNDHVIKDLFSIILLFYQHQFILNLNSILN